MNDAKAACAAKGIRWEVPLIYCPKCSCDDERMFHREQDGSLTCNQCAQNFGVREDRSTYKR